MRAVLSGSRRIAAAGRIARRMGTAGTSRKNGRDGLRVLREAACRRRIPSRDESAAGKPPPRGSADRAAIHHRLSEVEKPHGGIQPGEFAAGIVAAGEEANCFLAAEAVEGD